MFHHGISLLKESFKIFSANHAVRRGAAIAFYTVTSVTPVLIIVIAVAGLAFGDEAASGAVLEQFRGLLGEKGASLLQDAIASSAANPSAGTFAGLASVAGLVLAASGVFLELESGLNAIWETKPQGGFLNMARARIASLGLVVALGFLLMVSLVIDAALKGFSNVINAWLPFGATLLLAVSFVISLALITLLFAAIYRVLPARSLAWRDVLFGAVVTGVLFQAGKFLIGLYLGSNGLVSSLGAAGALLGLLLWVYYSAQIVLFGAALTRAHAPDIGKASAQPARPARNAA